MSKSRNQKGFSLIELMVVVAVLSIVAAIAVPNFLRYQARSRQAEAKVNLSAIFMAELAFYGELTRFSDTSQVGYQIVGGTNRYWYRTQQTDANATPGPTTILAGFGAVDPGDHAPPSNAQSSRFGFTATAAGNLDNDLTIDRWYVNDRKAGLTLALLGFDDVNQ